MKSKCLSRRELRNTHKQPTKNSHERKYWSLVMMYLVRSPHLLRLHVPQVVISCDGTRPGSRRDPESGKAVSRMQGAGRPWMTLPVPSLRGWVRQNVGPDVWDARWWRIGEYLTILLVGQSYVEYTSTVFHLALGKWQKRVVGSPQLVDGLGMVDRSPPRHLGRRNRPTRRPLLVSPLDPLRNPLPVPPLLRVRCRGPEGVGGGDPRSPEGELRIFFPPGVGVMLNHRLAVATEGGRTLFPPEVVVMLDHRLAEATDGLPLLHLPRESQAGST